MSVIDNEKEGWIQVASGKRFYLPNPTPDMIDIEDIATGLAHTNRYCGQTAEPYSVAQHSVLVSHLCSPSDALWGLLHDASEAYIGDVTRPLKMLDLMRRYKIIESFVMSAVTERFKLPPKMPASVRRADDVVWRYEALSLFPKIDPEWAATCKAGLPGGIWTQIDAAPHDHARRMFMDRFHQLTEAVAS